MLSSIYYGEIQSDKLVSWNGIKIHKYIGLENNQYINLEDENFLVLLINF